MDKIKHNNLIISGLVLLLLFIQRFIFGFSYYPTVDDWFLYLGRNMAAPDLATRPFAGLFDHYIIAPMSDHLVIIECLLLVMLVLGAYFIWRGLFPKPTGIDTVFILIVTMFPVAFEGLYWIASMARVVPSLFFIGLSIFTLRRYIDFVKTRDLIIFIISGIFAVGFYEAFIPVYLLLVCIITLNSKKKYWLIGIPIILTALMGVYYGINAQDVTISARFEFVKFKDLPQHIEYVYEQYKDLFKHGIELITGSFIDGIRGMKEYPIGGALVVLLSFAIGFFAKPVAVKNRVKYIWVSILLILGGVALNFIMCFVRLPFRMFTLMIVGIALLKQIIISYLPKIPYKIVAGTVALLFAICNIGSLTLYRYTNLQDREFVNTLIEEYNVGETDKFTYIINAPSYWYNDRVAVHEYVKAVTENYATIMSEVGYYTKNPDPQFIMCLHEWNSIGAFTPEEVDALYLYYDGAKLQECKLTTVSPGIDVTLRDGTKVGHITVENNLFTYKNIPQE